MSRTSIYLNFMGNTEEAFTFYKQVFGTEFSGPFQRMRDVPPQAGSAELPEDEKDKIMHVALPILGGTLLMGTDLLKSMGHEFKPGNNISISLEPDTRAETESLFQKLASGGSVSMPLSDMFWGDYFGSLTDKFGVQWMFNCHESA